MPHQQKQAVVQLNCILNAPQKPQMCAVNIDPCWH